ncbi:MAG TPA: ribonuclease PH [Thermomicrobiales bacterium]|nr:ribonuclease PH [Thermomicrobiales bacterium]
MTTHVVPVARSFGRTTEQGRPITIQTGTMPWAEGSATISLGNTVVLCTASVEERRPKWITQRGKGWVTAEYGMLPRATKERTQRESTQGKQGGRTLEIQRLISRSLRAIVDLDRLGERQILLDCDVLSADGGTRCASITGAYVAMALAIRKLIEQKRLREDPLLGQVAAISAGVVHGVPMLDLDYGEDSAADVDCNVVMTDAHAFVEIQGTAEGAPFMPATLDEIMVLASMGLDVLFAAQRDALQAASQEMMNSPIIDAAE